ncbi:MAG TPA: sialidase, partial [Gemmata sp.]|nr:sialidase [Gemmata sp.]
MRTPPLALLLISSIPLPARGADVPAKLAPYFKPPAELANDYGNYRSPLKFDDGTPVKNAAEWQNRRAEILKYWHGAMGEWPKLIDKPKVEYGAKVRREGVTQRAIKIETARGRIV